MLISRAIRDYPVELTFSDGQEIDSELLSEILDELEDCVSMLDPFEGAVLGRLNNSEPGELIDPGPVGGVIETVLDSTESCYGAFDPTVQILWDVYDFQLGGRYVSENELADALQWVDFRMLELDTGRILRKGENIRMGFGPILPGAMVDLLVVDLQNRGIDLPMITVGHSGYISDDGFIFDLTLPLDKISEITVQIVLGHIRIDPGEFFAAHDDDEKFFFSRGEQFHMVLDPNTGKPVREVRAAVVVSDESCVQASVYAYAVMVMGRDRGLEFLDETAGVEGVLFTEGTELYVSGGLGDRFWR